MDPVRGLPLLDKQIIILGKTALEKEVVVPMCVSTQFHQALRCCNSGGGGEKSPPSLPFSFLPGWL